MPLLLGSRADAAPPGEGVVPHEVLLVSGDHYPQLVVVPGNQFHPGVLGVVDPARGLVLREGLRPAKVEQFQVHVIQRGNNRQAVFYAEDDYYSCFE